MESSKAVALTPDSAFKVRELINATKPTKVGVQRGGGTRQVIYVKVTGERDEFNYYPCVPTDYNSDSEEWEEYAESRVFEANFLDLEIGTRYLAVCCGTREDGESSDVTETTIYATFLTGSGGNQRWAKITVQADSDPGAYEGVEVYLQAGTGAWVEVYPAVTLHIWRADSNDVGGGVTNPPLIPVDQIVPIFNATMEGGHTRYACPAPGGLQVIDTQVIVDWNADTCEAEFKIQRITGRDLTVELLDLPSSS